MFGIDPTAMAVTPGMILQAEAERRRQRLAEQEQSLAAARIGAQLTMQSYLASQKELFPEKPKPESWTRSTVPPPFVPASEKYTPTPGTPEYKAQEFRELALLAAKERLKEKPPKELSFEEQKIQEMWGGLTPEERKQVVGARITPIKPPKEVPEEEEVPEEVREELVPTGYTEKGGTRYGLPKEEKPAKESMKDTITRLAGELNITPSTEEVKLTDWQRFLQRFKKKPAGTDVLGIR